MSGFTNATVLGRLTRDPDFKYSAAGKPYCKIGIAVTEGFGDRKKTSFLDWTAFRGAETINEHFRKGDQILLSGRIEMDTWESHDGGGKRSKICFIVNEWSFVGSKTEAEHPQQTGVPPGPQHKEEVLEPAKGALTDSEIPF